MLAAAQFANVNSLGFGHRLHLSQVVRQVRKAGVVNTAHHEPVYDLFTEVSVLFREDCRTRVIVTIFITVNAQNLIAHFVPPIGAVVLV